MKGSHHLVTAAVVAATLAAPTAFAQDRHQEHARDRRGSTQAQPQQQQRRGNDDNRNNGNSNERRGNDDQRGNDDRRANDGARSNAERAVPRAVPREVPRSYDNRRYDDRRYDSRQYDNRSYSRPYYSRPYSIRPYFYRPYVGRPYIFRPRTTLRFGVVLGYPVPYYYAYPYPVPVYGYGAPPASVVVGPNAYGFGGVALEISPPDASVYVDGGYAGPVRDFDGVDGTLTLTAGRHRIEITAPGYEPFVVDVDAIGGQIVPVQGTLQPARYW